MNQDTTESSTTNNPKLCKMGCGFFVSICQLSVCSCVLDWITALEFFSWRSRVTSEPRRVWLIFEWPLQGSNATGDCCSKCWGAIQASQQTTENSTETKKEPQQQPINVTKEAVVQVPKQQEQQQQEKKVEKPAGEEKVRATPLKKKKKKKMSYKNMMSGITSGSGQKDVDKEKEKLKKVVGGGNFVKVDKI